MSPQNGQPRTRKRAGTIQKPALELERDPNHHLTGSFLPQTPLGSAPVSRTGSPVSRPPAFRKPKTPWWLKWATDPFIAFKVALVPLVLYFNWELVTPYVAPHLDVRNPFAPLFLISGRIEDSKPGDTRYSKSWFDIPFLAYYVVVFSMVRQFLTVNVSAPIARYFGLRKEGKIERFGEQFYALIYFSIFGSWGYRVMTSLPTYWYNTDALWLDYPHWDMLPELKAYYLVQSAYWLQQFLVLVLGLEKPRKDYFELVCHHFVTLWLVGWSYLLNLTIIGNAIYMSMDIPDAFLATSKLLNYIQWDQAKMYAYVTFIGVWSYFRHYLNLKILWSVWFDCYKLVPAWTKTWDWNAGVYMVSWLPPLVFLSIAALQVLNLFWYWLMLRILVRAIITKTADDERSEDEDDGEDEPTDDKDD
ncbi:longevity assurance proteins LAG1 LAC1 [Coprinellus micaceus]|uniref:Longevity assurance proteins LAG1 LAC1 n=1 Tax=Coprinellus micaceus TaxID=71717 RepID=A0A4Y7TQ01_COPMI|nr:longevity assurance proteins LAG1 LAC1 [Coprinellus micaceus]